MLKIKDDVDLKELEKFGFVDNNCYCTLYGDYADLFVDKEGGRIFIEEDTCSYEKTDVLDVLFDLIQAGLVEKWRNKGKQIQQLQEHIQQYKTTQEGV